MTEPGLVLRGGRVMDPETGLDSVADVTIDANSLTGGSRVTAIGTGLPPGRREVDVSGLVVTAGFVDMHSRAFDTGGLRLQARDGVTTALELEPR